MKNYVKRISLCLGLASCAFAQTTTAPIYTMSIVAGIPSGNSLGDGGNSVSGIVTAPQGIAVDASGNIYIADNSNSRIRKIDGTTGIISTFTNTNVSGPNGMAFDKQGNLWVAQSGDHRTIRISADGKTVTQMSHNGTTNTFGGDNNYAVDAYFNSPGGIAVDNAGNVYIADTSNNRVRMMKNTNNCINTPVTISGVAKNNSCTVVTIAGGSALNPQLGTACGANNTCAPSGNNTVGDGGPALLARVNGPYGIAVTPDGSTVYVAQSSDHRIRAINMTNGTISTVIGNCLTGSVVVPCPSGSFGSATVGTSYGDGKSASQGTTNTPRGLFLDSANNILYFADGGIGANNTAPSGSNSRGAIRAINLNTGIVNTVVGGGNVAGDSAVGLNSGLLTSISLSSPWAVWVQSGLIYFTEQAVNKVRVADPVAQTVRTLVSTPKSSGSGTLATQANLGFATTLTNATSPRVAVDAAGNLYAVEASTNKIRKITPDGTINEWAGTGAAGTTGDGGPAISARLNAPQSVAFDSKGNAYIADTGNNSIRKVDTNGVITTIVGRAQNTKCSSAASATGCAVDKSDYVGDGGTPANAVLKGPQGVAVDSNGNLVIADTGHNSIRYADLTNNVITTIAGGAPAGTPDGPTDGRSGLGSSGLFDSTNALLGLLNTPRGVAVDSNGNIYIADYANAAVRELVPVTLGAYGLFTFYGSGSSSGTAPGIPTGTGTASVPARIRMSSNNATSIAVDSGNNIYIAEAADNRLVVVSADHSRAYQVAGGGSNDTGSNYTSGNAFNLQVPSVTGVAVATDGTVYTADRTGVVRKLVCTSNCLPLK